MKLLILAASLAGAAVVATPAMAAGAMDVAAEVGEAATTLAPNGYVWRDDGTGGTVTVVVSLPLQRAFVYRGRDLVAATSVSSGKDGKDTPVGIYPILQKEAVHHSNLYNSASMPFMERLTWDGIALHAGNNPGFADSHGCVRLPTAFAQKLFGITSIGTTVVVTDQAVGSGPLDPALLQTDASRANAEQLASLNDG